MGQDAFIIGRSRWGLGAFCSILGAVGPGCWRGRAVRAGAAGRVGLAPALAGGFLVRLGRLLVRLAAVVRLVEARALEDDRGPGAEDAAQLELAALGTLLQGLFAHGLELIEVVPAGVTLVFIGWHGR